VSFQRGLEVPLLATNMPGSTNVYLDIFIGNREEHAKAQAAYKATCSLLSKNAKVYGLPTSPADLSEEQQEILADLDVQIHCQPYLLSNV
jgi:hypothetical protein